MCCFFFFFFVFFFFSDHLWHKAVDCLQDLMDACEGDNEEGQKLRKYVNVDNTRKSVNYLCENLDGMYLTYI